MDVVIQKIRKYMSDHQMTRPGDRIVAGVSGGADSLCLLFALWELFHEDHEIEVVHVDHMIRGEEALADAAFVSSLCRRLDVPCHVIHADCPKIAEKTGESLEEAGRRIRYESFLSLGPDRIAVAHHMGDQAETVLGNMIRGSGLLGMGGIRPVSVRDNIPVIHPLLCLSREEIEGYLARRGQEYCTDSTNEELLYTRNRIRGKIMPELEQINPESVEHICKMAETLRGAHEYLSNSLKQDYSAVLLQEELTGEKRVIRLCAKRLSAMNCFGAESILRMAYERLVGGLKDFGSVHSSQLLKLCQGQSGRSLTLPGGVHAIREGDALILTGGETEEGCFSPALMPELSTRIISLNGSVSMDSIPKETYTKWFDYDKIPSDIVLRKRQEGDYIILDFGRQKLQDYLINEKVPRSQRDFVPLLASGSEILWVVGKRIGSRCKVTEQTRTILECSVHFPEEAPGSGKERADG